LFRCISGMQPPTTGAVRLNDSKHVVTPGEVGVVQQAYPLLMHRTVWSNLLLAARKKKDGVARAEELLAHFGLADKKNSYPLELSGGQRQRIAIVQQLLCSAYFLLMDEPFSGLDMVAKGRVFDTIRTVSTTNELNTVIFTSHDLESAVTLADQIWIIGKEGDKPGSTVVKKIDLAATGLAWTPDIERHQQYWPTVLELKSILQGLS
jgi:ABC-type nitrate/sulfonate/bicarbonate transport system ATPase subunit